MTKFEKVGWKVLMWVALVFAGFGWKDISIVTDDIAVYLHELGHAVFSLGGIIVGPSCMVQVDWIGGTMGSMLFQHLLCAAIIAFSVYFKPLGGFGVGYSLFVTYDVFQLIQPVRHDMVNYTGLRYYLTTICTAAIIAEVLYTTITGKVPWHKANQRFIAWFKINMEVTNGGYMGSNNRRR
ncbi:hypothetical protein MASR2M78_30390 [Treponema sp.]